MFPSQANIETIFLYTVVAAGAMPPVATKLVKQIGLATAFPPPLPSR